MTFSQPWALLLLPLVLIPLWLSRQQGHVYSWMAIVPKDRLSQVMGLLMRYLVAAILGCLIVALAGPQGEATKVERTGKGAQVVLVIDRSASMDDPFAGAGTEGRVGENKAAAAKRLITQFVRDRKDDMVGVVAFSNSAMHAIPLTQSREAIYAAIRAAGGSGLLQTNIGAGLTSGLAMFEKIPDSGSRAIILLSDGAGRISPKAKQKISDWMVRQHVNLYWIVLRQPDGISIFSTNYQADKDGLEPAEIELHKFFQTIKTKYKAYEAEDPKTLQSAIQDINTRERNPIRYFEKIPGKDYSSFFVAMAAFMIGLLLLIRYMEVQSWQQA
jgi:mxaC protein